MYNYPIQTISFRKQRMLDLISGRLIKLNYVFSENTVYEKSETDKVALITFRKAPHLHNFATVTLTDRCRYYASYFHVSETFLRNGHVKHAIKLDINNLYYVFSLAFLRITSVRYQQFRILLRAVLQQRYKNGQFLNSTVIFTETFTCPKGGALRKS